MFQTDFIIYLQSLTLAGLDLFMSFFLVIGDEGVIIFAALLVIFGISFRRGFLLFQILLWTGMITVVLKTFFALPRTFHVDSNVQSLGGLGSRLPFNSFNGMGAKGFFDMLDRQVVETFRRQVQQNSHAYGFPSGHVSMAMALWGGLALLFKKRILWGLAAIMVILMSLSRMYMGEHFLADVVGGAFLGGGCLLAAYLLLARYKSLDEFFNQTTFTPAVKLPNALIFCLMFVAPVLLALVYPAVLPITAMFLGANTAFILVLSKGVPDESGTLLKRAGRVLMGFSLFFITMLIIISGFGMLGLGEARWVEPVASAIALFNSVWGTVNIGARFGLYQRDTTKQKKVQILMDAG